MSRLSLLATSFVVSSCVLGCGSAPEQSIQRYAVQVRMADQVVVATSTTPLHVEAGDVVEMNVVGVTADGTAVTPPIEASVDWSGAPVVTVASATDPDADPMSAVSDDAPAVVIRDPGRFTNIDQSALLGVLGGAGQDTPAEIRATVSGAAAAGDFGLRIVTSPMPAGDAMRGMALYESNCARCHGIEGEGAGDAPGLNAKEGNVAGDPSWNAALFAVGARVGMDNDGIALDPEMPLWLTEKTEAGPLLTTQDFADMYAFLTTETR